MKDIGEKKKKHAKKTSDINGGSRMQEDDAGETLGIDAAGRKRRTTKRKEKLYSLSSL